MYKNTIQTLVDIIRESRLEEASEEAMSKDKFRKAVYDILTKRGPDIDYFSSSFTKVVNKIKKTGIQASDSIGIEKWLSANKFFGSKVNSLGGDKYYNESKLEEAASKNDPLEAEYKTRIKKITGLKWDPAKASYDKPGTVSKEGATTSIMGSIKGEKVSFDFWHPEITGGRMITGWIFQGVAAKGSYGPNEFNTTEKKISASTDVSPAIKRMRAWEAIPEDLRRANLKELDDAIKKYSK
jgi:hypothetical protein